MVSAGVKLNDIGMITDEMTKKLFISAHYCYMDKYKDNKKNITNSK
tara:strand:- start:447 stop:584 length:138 start_codon:yes stop_codon:yes gene_type:complete